jgi:hypothetical protein
LLRAQKSPRPCENTSSARPLVKNASSRVRSLVRMLSLASIVATAACGGDDDRPPTTPPPTTPPPTSPPPSGDGVTVTGSERIGWTQTVQASQSIQQFRFAAYVDNRSRANLASVQCASSGTANVFNCSAALPQMSQGRHSLQLSTFDPAGAESAPSAELVLNVVARIVVSSAPVPGVPATTCVDATGASACYAVDVLVQGLAQPSNLLTTADGRLLFVERQTEVFLFERGQLLRSTLVPPDSVRRFSRSHSPPTSRAAVMCLPQSPLRETNSERSRIVRFREAGGTLAEAAVIVPDLPIAKGGEVALSVGDGNDLYVALPAADTTNPSSAGSFCDSIRKVLPKDSHAWPHRCLPSPARVPRNSHGVTGDCGSRVSRQRPHRRWANCRWSATLHRTPGRVTPSRCR